MKHWIMKVQESQGHVISDRRIINGTAFFKECKLSNCMLVLFLEIAQLDWSVLQSRAWYSSGMKTLFIIYLKLSYSLFCLFLYLVLLNRAVDRYRLLADLDEWLLHRGCKTLMFVSSPGLSHPSALRRRKVAHTSLSSCWWILKRKSQKYLQVTFTVHLTVTSNCWYIWITLMYKRRFGRFFMGATHIHNSAAQPPNAFSLQMWHNLRENKQAFKWFEIYWQ